jgi:hypothetical protein
LYNVIVFWIETILNTSQPFLSAWFFMNFKLLKLFSVWKQLNIISYTVYLLAYFKEMALFAIKAWILDKEFLVTLEFTSICMHELVL